MIYQDRMVLRTHWMSRDLYHELRAVASRANISLNDLLIELIAMGIETVKAGGSKRLKVVRR